MRIIACTTYRPFHESFFHFLEEFLEIGGRLWNAMTALLLVTMQSKCHQIVDIDCRILVLVHFAFAHQNKLGTIIVVIDFEALRDIVGVRHVDTAAMHETAQSGA